MLEVQYLGQSMQVPISEVLSFAFRWQTDRDEQMALDQTPRLNLHPYPVYGTRLDDPDLPEWWV